MLKPLPLGSVYQVILYCILGTLFLFVCFYTHKKTVDFYLFLYSFAFYIHGEILRTVLTHVRCLLKRCGLPFRWRKGNYCCCCHCPCNARKPPRCSYPPVACCPALYPGPALKPRSRSVTDTHSLFAHAAETSVFQYCFVTLVNCYFFFFFKLCF